MIKIIVARSSNGVIGRDGELPWRLPGDLKRFAELTRGNTVVMGSKTYWSLPESSRPLPGRQNIVLSRHTNLIVGAQVVPDLESAIKAAQGHGDVFICGGQSVYAEALTLADEVIMTLIEDAVDGNRFFPHLDAAVWREAWRGPLQFENDLQYRFITYERR